MPAVDAEVLKKHHFWIGLGLLLVPIFLALFGALGVSDATEEKLTKNKAAKDEIDKTKTQSKAKLGKLEEQKGYLYKTLDKMWEDAWNSQKEIYTWPQGLQPHHQAVLNKLKFGTDINSSIFDDKKTAPAAPTPAPAPPGVPAAPGGAQPAVVNITDEQARARNEVNTLRDQFREKYALEYQKLSDNIYPMYFNNGLDFVVKYVKSFPILPSSEDLWLAMEDLWVNRIIVETIDEVNKNAAKFAPVEATLANKLKRSFRSPLWQVDLEIAESEDRRDRIMKGKITNITNRLLPLGFGNQMILKVWLDPDPKEAPFEFIVEGEHVHAGETVEIKTIPAHKIRSGKRIEELNRVEQVFDLKTVPVKRIDRLEMGYRSNRQQGLTLKMAPISEKAIAVNADPNAPPGAPVAPPPGDTRGGAGGTGAADALDLSPCKLTRKRYIDVTMQVRRMPIGIVVICEQPFVEDILVSLANTKLRFQITQEHIKRSRDEKVMNPPDSTQTPGSPTPPAAGGFQGPSSPPPQSPSAGAGLQGGDGRGSGMGPRAGRLGIEGGGGPPRSGGPAGPGAGPSPGANLSTTNDPPPDQTSNNLVELSVYGVASLYEQAVKSGPEPAPKVDAPIKK